jgi:D-glycero-D-manno-heptose 1,7-bisphosphate phosphatase
MPLYLLDRDGVVIVNRATNVKTPGELELLPGVPEAIARLNGAGFDVAICTNQPEVARGVLSLEQLNVVQKPCARCLPPEVPRSNLPCAAATTIRVREESAAKARGRYAS